MGTVEVDRHWRGKSGSVRVVGQNVGSADRAGTDRMPRPWDDGSVDSCDKIAGAVFAAAATATGWPDQMASLTGTASQTDG